MFRFGGKKYPGILKNQYQVEEELEIKGFSEFYKVTDVLDKEEKEYRARLVVLPKEVLREDYQAIFEKRTAQIKAFSETGGACLVFSGSDADEIKDQFQYTTLYDSFETATLAEEMEVKDETDGPASRRFEPDELKRFLLALCDALGSLHDFSNGKESCCHLDLAPGHILWGEEKIRFTDFRIHSLLFKKGEDLAGEDEDLGELLWTAPEVLRGETERIGPWSDIWSVGVMMYQLMDCQYPFVGNSNRERLINAVAGHENKKYLDYLPEDLRRIIDQCLEKKPEYRCQSAWELKQDLESVMFTKHCTRNHENPYYKDQCHCKAGFAASPPDDDDDDDGGGGEVGRWFTLSQFQERLFPGEEIEIKLDIQLNLHEAYPSFRHKGYKVAVELVPQGVQLPSEICSIRFFPDPRFKVTPETIRISADPLKKTGEVELFLTLVESEVVIEKVTADIGKINIPASAFDFKDHGKRIRSGMGAIPLKMTVRYDDFKVDTPYECSLNLQLKNREKPMVLDRHHLDKPIMFSLADPPRMIFVPNEDVVRMEVFKGQELTRLVRSFTLRNVGKVPVRISTIAVVPESEREGDETLPDFIRFINHDKGLGPGLETTVFIGLNPEKITGANQSNRIQIQYQYFYQNEWEDQKIETPLFISVHDLQKGELLAIDFGTTNSYCAAFMSLMDLSPKTILLEAATSKKGIIPSVIEYKQMNEWLIGRDPLDGYQRGKQNIFKSFKRQFGNRKKLFSIIRTKGEMDNYDAEQLVMDYLNKILESIKAEKGIYFENFVFTHPSNMDLNRQNQFREMFHKMGIDPSRCVFIDEASASALYSIGEYAESWLDRYRLIVFDFGGGTTDMAYFLVNNRHQEDVFEVSILGIDGLPEFGGDDLTDIMFDLMLKDVKVEKGEKLLLPRPPERHGKRHDYQDLDSIGYDPLFETQCKSNWGVLKGAAEKLKVLLSVSGSEEKSIKVLLFFKKDQEKSPGERAMTFVVEPSTYETLAREMINKGLDRTVEMMKNNQQYIDEDYVDTPVYVVLSGKSSEYYLVKEMFEEKMGKGQDKIDKVEAIVLSDRLKECVAAGASAYWFSKKETHSIILKGGDGVNRTRIGLRTIKRMRIPQFNEIVGYNKKLVPKGIKPDGLDPELAMGEEQYLFNFDSAGTIETPIPLFQHSGSNNDFNDRVCSLVGLYKISQCPQWANDSRQGILRVEVDEDLRINVRVTIEDQCFDAQRIEELMD